MSAFLPDRSNFSIQRDQTFDHVQNLHRLGLPINTTIDPEDDDTRRVNVAPEGSIVYCKKAAEDHCRDKCDDGLNHLYFSDGEQWIPLRNCRLPDSVCENENDALRSDIAALKSQMADVLAQLGAS